MLVPALSLALALAVQASTAAPTASSAAAAQPSPTPASNAVTCRTEMETGSRFTHRTCHTAADWAQIESDARNQVMQDQRMSGQTGTSGGH